MRKSTRGQMFPRRFLDDINAVFRDASNPDDWIAIFILTYILVLTSLHDIIIKKGEGNVNGFTISESR